MEGNQVFNFPNLSLQPGKIIYVTSGANAREGDNYLKWTTKQIWLNDGDAAQLRNEKGELVSELD
ncbi:lamin tail domain-containing protein [Lysinibacillus sp. MHQ-1]|nr:lamin tail domain-containing protein [Lysinibacillus sp. MHQ-1]